MPPTSNRGPATPGGTILVRCPYGRSFRSRCSMRALRCRGYHVLFQSVRGTFGSGGEFVPMVDAADTVAWLREQPWFTGKFATIGLAYLGYTQWALLRDPPPGIGCRGGDGRARHALLGVGNRIVHPERLPLGGATSSEIRSNRHYGACCFRCVPPNDSTDRGLQGLPLGTAGREFLGTTAPWYESWIEHPDSADPFWTDLRALDALDRVETPVLLISGWQDLFPQPDDRSVSTPPQPKASTWRSLSVRGHIST